MLIITYIIIPAVVGIANGVAIGRGLANRDSILVVAGVVSEGFYLLSLWT